VAAEFECEPRGTIAVKGKGEMEIWHVLRRRQDGSSATSADQEPERLTPVGVVKA
jgi:hypothetical protein